MGVAKTIGYVDSYAVENYIKSELKGKVDGKYAQSAERVTYK